MATIWCVPTGRFETVNNALPLASRGTVPMLVPSEVKLTVPMGMGPEVDVTFAVNVTGFPT